MDKKRITRVLILTALILIAFYLLVRSRGRSVFAAESPRGVPPTPGQPQQLSLSLEGKVGFPECFGTYDKITEGEERVIFSVGTGVKTSIYQNFRDSDIEVLEILMECINANTFQLSKTGLVLTPIWDFAARQTYSDPGFVLRKGEEIFIAPTSATSVVGYIRFRERGTAVCNVPPTSLSSPLAPISEASILSSPVPEAPLTEAPLLAETQSFIRPPEREFDTSFRRFEATLF